MNKRRRKQELTVKITISVAALIFLGGMAVKGLFGKEQEISEEKNVNKVAVMPEEIETQETEEEQETIHDYPGRAENYMEIDSEEVKSPYVALLDVEENKLVAGRNAEAKIYPASMTKVMSLIVAVEQLQDLSMTFSITADIVDPLYRAEASRAGFEPGDSVTVEDMLYGLILPSGADAAVGLSVLAAGSEEAFADLMNEKCAELGLTQTHFVNASGLHDENQFTTPLEMAVILKYAMENEVCAKVLSTYQYTTAPLASNPEGILLTSTMFSRMYGNEVEGVSIMAGKTGYTQEAKHCLVSFAEKNGHHYVATTAGAENKWHAIFDDFEIYGKYLLQ